MDNRKPTVQMVAVTRGTRRGYPVERYIAQDTATLPAYRHGLARAIELLVDIRNVLLTRNNCRKHLLTREEAADALRLDVKTFDAWRDNGVLVEGRHYIREGRIIRVHPEFIDRLFDGKQALTAQGAEGAGPTQLPEPTDHDKPRAKASKPSKRGGRGKKCPFAPSFLNGAA